MSEGAYRMMTHRRDADEPRMNDSSGASVSKPPAIALAGVNLALGSGAARVHILKDIDLHIGRGEAVAWSAIRLRQVDAAHGHGRAGAPDTGNVMVAGENLIRMDEDTLARFRGRNVGIVFQSFHLIPTMTAIENVAVPLELAVLPTRSTAPAPSSPRSGSATACSTIRRSSPAASSNASRWRARWHPIRQSWWPTSRPAS